VGTTQTDIKRVIAYSTCSQLGYMFFAAGVGAYNAAMFHLFTHAFFKALLFLGAGSVIHAMHHEQDMRYYGGLRKKIPFTFAAMMAGTLAITGVGIAGLFGFAGFYSKDAIIEAAFASGTESGGVAFAVAVFAALLTSFYSWRLIFLTFYGTPRWEQSEHIQHALHETHAHEYHPHESPVTMLVPIGFLAVGAVFAGYVFHGQFLDAELGAKFWNGSLAFDAHLMHTMHEVPEWVKLSATVVMLLGLFTAWMAYIRDTSIPARFVATFPAIYRFLLNKWYWDELYNLIFVRPAFWFGRLFWKQGDQGTIDRFGPNGLASVTMLGSRVAGRLQTGLLSSYAFAMLLGLAGIATWAMTR
jgi:NADH-quinone oxidoreductase subunit L